MPSPPPKKIKVRPLTRPRDGDDQLPCSKRRPIFSSSLATSRPVFLSRTIKVGASGLETCHAAHQSVGGAGIEQLAVNQKCVPQTSCRTTFSSVMKSISR